MPRRSRIDAAGALHHVLARDIERGSVFLNDADRDRLLEQLAEDERQILASPQFTLERHRQISQLFIDGILGDNFQCPLSFYLSRYKEYLESITGLAFGENFADPPAESSLSS
jgi:hypothetical protein